MEENAIGAGPCMLPAQFRAPLLHAGFWRRVAACLIDVLVMASVLVTLERVWIFPLMMQLARQPGVPFPLARCLGYMAVVIVIPWLYYAVCESSRWQATVGKLALGLRVTDECGDRVGFARATGRHFGKIMSALIMCVGFLLAGWTARKQALHDLLAACCVVRAGGLAAWQHQTVSLADAAAPNGNAAARPGMPGWAIALIVMAGGLFVGVPVLAMVAAVTIPVYRNHAVRAEISQGIALTERPRALIAEYIGVRGALPGNNAALGLPRPEAIRARYVTSVQVDGGKVVVTYGNQAARVIRGGHVVVAPYGNAALLHWQCSSRDIESRYLPTNCRD